jgi:O-acetylhomoserine (thiol)-lyase
MKSDTVAVHGGYDTEPTTRAVAVPIYQTVAYEFESADHGAALFNLEVEGHRYSRISNPTTAVLERRIAELEGGLEALCVSSGQAALNYAILNLADIGTNIVSVPQLYGTTHTLFAHVLPSQGIEVRFAASDGADAIETLIDQNTRGIFCESIGNPAGNICDIEKLAAVAKRHGIPLVVDNTVATPILLRPIDYGADIIIQSLTKFLGGHGTTLGGAVLSRPDLYRAFRQGRLHRALPQCLSARHRRCVVATRRVPAAARRRDGSVAGRAPCRERAPRRRIPA